MILVVSIVSTEGGLPLIYFPSVYSTVGVSLVEFREYHGVVKAVEKAVEKLINERDGYRFRW